MPPTPENSKKMFFCILLIGSYFLWVYGCKKQKIHDIAKKEVQATAMLDNILQKKKAEWSHFYWINHHYHRHEKYIYKLLSIQDAYPNVPSATEACYIAAGLYLEKKDYQAAINTYKVPRNTRASEEQYRNYCMGICYMHLGESHNYHHAARCFNKAAQYTENQKIKLQALWAAAYAHQKTGQKEKSQATLATIAHSYTEKSIQTAIKKAQKSLSSLSKLAQKATQNSLAQDIF